MKSRMVKTVDCTIDVSKELIGWCELNSGVVCRIRVFVPDGSIQERLSDWLPALPILILCWTIRGNDGLSNGLPPGWLESYARMLHLGIASLPRPVTFIERFAGRDDFTTVREETVRRVFFGGSEGRMTATFQTLPTHEVELAIGERLNEEGVRTGRENHREDGEHSCREQEILFPLFGKRGPCFPNGRTSLNDIGSLGEAIHQAAVSLSEKKERGPILDERLEYHGYHSCYSVCRMRVFDPNGGNGWPDKRPLVVIFTELPDNPGTSVTNRIEHLATLVWHRLGKPEAVPVFIEHYPNRGVYCRALNRWQIPESFSFVGMHQDAQGTFHNPRWEHTTRMTVEVILGQQLVQ